MKIAIIGAGMTGLSVAHHLIPECEIAIFEKSRGLGGRMSTRRAEPFSFDHGAQYFVAKTNEFQEFLTKPLQSGVIDLWNARFAEIDASSLSTLRHKQWDKEFPHYVGTPTMNALVKFMAAEFKIHKKQRVTNVEPKANGDLTRLVDDTGTELGYFNWVISTAPVAQTRELFGEGFRHSDRLKNSTLLPCFSLMLGFDHPLELAFEAALIHNSSLSWIALNNSKPQRPSQSSLVIQSNNVWAQDHVDHDPEWIEQIMRTEATRILGQRLDNYSYSSIHRWLYANTKSQKVRNGDVYIDEKNKLAAAGDWCGNARVESAFLHGKKLAEELNVIFL